MLKIAIGAAVLFPWGFVLLTVLGALHRRRTARKARSILREVLRPSEYIAPRTDAPILLDSAQIVKHLRESKQ